MPTTRARPDVSVPVLSKASNRARASASSAPGSRTRQPCRASRPMPSEVARERRGPPHTGRRPRAPRGRSAAPDRRATFAPSRRPSTRRATGRAAPICRPRGRQGAGRTAAGQRLANRAADLRPAGCGSAPLLRIRSGPSRLMLPAITVEPALFVDRPAFAGDHGFIGVRFPFDDHAVDRNALARPDPHQRAGARSRARGGAISDAAIDNRCASRFRRPSRGSRSRAALARPTASR